MIAIRRSFVMLLALPVMLAAAGDYLLYGTSIGVSAAVFFAVAVVLLIARTGLPGKVRGQYAAVLLALLAGLLVALAKEPRTLGVLLAVVVLLLLATTIRGGPEATIRRWLARLALVAAELPLRPLVDQINMGRWFYRHRRLVPRWALSLLLWGLAGAAGLVFVVLFIVGNPIISDLAERSFHTVIRLLRTIPEWLTVGRVGLWLGLMVGGYGLLRLRRWGRRAAAAPPVIAAPLGSVVHEDALAVRALVVFNLIFLVETVIDVVYLWGGAALPRGLTYADFAHRAAYPLVAAALLAAGFVLMLHRENGPATRSRVIKVLVFVWLAQNALLVLSCLLRLKMYVGVYSLTYWRVAAIIWSGLVLVGLALIVLKMVRRRSNLWLMRANTIAAAVTLYACAFVNFEMLIANFNVRHCREVDGQGAPLDLAYLYELGPAALPALQEARVHLDGESRADADMIAAALYADLDEQTRDWRGWTFDRQRTAMHVAPSYSVASEP